MYNTETAQVAGYYAAQKKFHALNGIGPIEDIFSQICGVIDQHKAVAPESPAAKKLMDEGLLVPDAVVIGMIGSALKDNPQAGGFIFDGFPRTVAQAESLDQLMAEHNTHIGCMIALEVQEEELVKRLLERGKTSNRPDDQDETKIRRRVTVYNTETAQVAGYYAAQKKFHALNGIGPIDDIFGQICGIIDQHQTAAPEAPAAATKEVKA